MGPMPMELHGGKGLIKVLHSPPQPIGIIMPKLQREKGRK
jgi:hypothetical protein